MNESPPTTRYHVQVCCSSDDWVTFVIHPDLSAARAEYLRISRLFCSDGMSRHVRLKKSVDTVLEMT